MTTTKKQQNNSIRAAALLLSISVEKLEELLDLQMVLSVCQNEKRQIADMYKKLYEGDAERVNAGNALASFDDATNSQQFKELVSQWKKALKK